MTRLDAWIDRWLLAYAPPQAPVVARWDIATFAPSRPVETPIPRLIATFEATP